jgi:hypothetical protein
MDGLLWTVEGGTLYRTDPKTANWKQVGDEGEWAQTAVFVG